MITVELTDGWDGKTLEASYEPNQERICDVVRRLVAGRYQIDPTDYWTWTLCANGDEIIDFGSHTFFARVLAFDATTKLKDKMTVLNDQQAKRNEVTK